MKTTIGNVLKGKVVEIKKGMMMTRLKVDIGHDRIITVLVNDVAWKELEANVGDELEVLTKTGLRSPGNLH
jgi:molybdopterin-binding protein